METHSSTSQIIRRAGSLEHMFQISYQLANAFLVSSLYKLSTTITLSQLQKAAEILRFNHPMLNVTCVVNSKKNIAHYMSADQLQTFVKQIKSPEDPHQLFHKLLHDSLFQQQRLDQTYLPWGLILSSDSQHIIFISPHTFIDGISLQIIGADLVRAINNTYVKHSATPAFPPPLESLLPSVPLIKRSIYCLKTIFRFFSRIETAGIPFKLLSKDPSIRKAVSNYTTINLSDIFNFHQRCKQNGFSLNSGMISAFYEAISTSSYFNTNNRNLPLAAPMDARRRIGKNSSVTLTTIGAYVGSTQIKETGNSGNWEQRAKRIQRKVHEGNAVKQFVAESFGTKLLVKYAEKIIPSLTKGKELGRFECLCLSNLGIAKDIEMANRECEEGVKIDEMFFDESGTEIGCILSLHLVTIEEKVCWYLCGFNPMIVQECLDELNNRFCEMLKS